MIKDHKLNTDMTFKITLEDFIRIGKMVFTAT